MEQQNIKPNALTLTCLLNGCSHAGLVDEAWALYSTMEERYGITPDYFHHCCMVDALARSGKLEQAETFINKLPEKHIVIWKALLGASHSHKNIHYAELAASRILEAEPLDAATYVSLANTYGAIGNAEQKARLWAEMKKKKIKKIPGKTWVTVNGKTEVFLVGAKRHPYPVILLDYYYSLILYRDRQKIIDLLAKSRAELSERFNYTPDISCVSRLLPTKQENVALLWSHSEKMALGWALLSLSTGKIIMHNNLKVCHDCHNALKLLSELLKRTIIMRDTSQFHRFENGKCNCGDYW